MLIPHFCVILLLLYRSKMLASRHFCKHCAISLALSLDLFNTILDKRKPLPESYPQSAAPSENDLKGKRQDS